MNEVKNPKWTKDETILCLNFYFQHKPSIPNEQSEHFKNLHEKIHRLNAINNVSGNLKFRNKNGIYMKLMNLMHLDPDTKTGLPRNSKVDHEVWNKYSDEPTKLKFVADKIEDYINDSKINFHELVIDEGEMEPEEGKIFFKVHKFYERDKKIIKLKKDKALKNSGKLECEVCTFDFHEIYGERGHGFVECHHNVPVSELPTGYKTTLSDLSLLCSNCHRMVHRQKPWLSVAQLKELMARK